MSERPFEPKPTLGVKMVLTALCVIVDTLMAFYFFR